MAERVYLTECNTCDKTNYSWKCNQSQCIHCGEHTLTFTGTMNREEPQYDTFADKADNQAERGY